MSCANIVAREIRGRFWIPGVYHVNFKVRTIMEHLENTQVLEKERKEEKGASMLEYALMAALIAVVCIAAVTFLGRQASVTFSTVGSSMAGG